MRYLALGDSYTIGELVKYELNFPSQLVSKLHATGIDMTLEQLIAVTGWTTDELALAIEKASPDRNYDWVTLLIGVNNQYRGRSIDEYRWQFYSLLCQALLFAKGQSDRVVVLSIPDWGLTPFNKEIDPVEISKSIDAFNEVNKEITERMGCHYLDVTCSTREHARHPAFLAEDQLHYSAKEYGLWADQLKDIVHFVMKK